MNQLHGRVLELFLKDKKDNKIRNIEYGKKALEKYVDASFKNRDEKDKKKYLKRWDSSKLSNSVYFVYQSGRGKGHRVISNASKKGGYSYLGHLEDKNNKLFRKRVPLSVRRKRSRSRRRVQRGGIVCAPCLIGPVAGALGVGTAGYLVSRRSSSSIVNGKRSLKRKEIYEMNKNGKKVRKTFIQDGLNLKLAGKKVKAKTMKKSIKRFNNAVKRCIKSGFKKC